MGPYRGAQAGLLRVPYADANCIPVPGEPGDDLEDALVLLADAFVTGWHATELARVYPGCTAAVFGAGTIGLLSAYSCLLRGADVVYVVDYVPERLAMAAELGAVPVDLRMGDPVDQIRGLRRSRGLPIGEEPMNGVDIVIDAVGFQARDRAAVSQGHPDHENPAQVIGTWPGWSTPPGTPASSAYTPRRTCTRSRRTRPTATSPFRGPPSSPKGVSVGFGRTHDRRYTVLLRDMILSGRARPAAIVTHHGTLDDAPALYQAFDQRADGVIKAVLHP